MEAIANNPAFAKKVGVPQSVGKDYAAADKGKKFAAGGALAKINKQDTRHGAMDMPFKKLTKFAGMKKGGKTKRYDIGGGVREGQNENIDDDSRARAMAFVNRGGDDSSDTPAVAPVARSTYARPVSRPSSATPYARPAGPSRSEIAKMAAEPAVERVAAGRAAPLTEEAPKTGAAFGMTPRGQLSRLAKKSAETSDEKKQEVTDRLATLASLTPAGRGVQATYRGARALGAGAKSARASMEKAAESTASRYRGETNPRGWENMSLSERAKATGGYKKGGMTKRFAQGGVMKESKAMVGKEVNFMKKKGAPKSMIKHEAAEMGAMKKGGMPMKDGKPAFMQKKMMGGGMAKYAKGGGIESRGKTKGTVIKMATGGVVKFAKGGGIESRGKTKGTMIKMKGC
jgi:hypothetical protein